MSPPVLSIAGRSGAGKTVLIEKLLPALAERGLSVATVKHHPEAIETDRPGKDTWRHRSAGAAGTVLVAPGLATFHLPLAGETGWLEASLRLFAPFDLLLVEGFKKAHLPKIELVGAGALPLGLTPPPLAFVVPEFGDPRAPSFPEAVPVFQRDEAPGLAGFIDDWRRRASSAERAKERA